jgi:hypothetical protein
MDETTDLLACCGLYCGDCAGYSGEIADRARELVATMKKYRFELTAKHLFPEKIKDYPGLAEMLDFMTELTCPAVCRQREDGTTSCEIRKCCRDKGFYACHECDSFEACDKLKLMEPLHGDSCVRNLRAIREMGPEAWVAHGTRLWFGSSVDESR